MIVLIRLGLLALSVLLAALAGPAIAGHAGVSGATPPAAGPPAGADRPSPLAPEAAGPPEVAAIQIRDEVERLIAAAEAEALFENLSTNRIGAARHRASGLVCIFAPGDPLNLIVVYRSRPNGPALGEDVSCRTGVGDGAFVTVYATRYPLQPTEEALLEQAVREVRGVWREVEPLEGGYTLEAPPNYPEPLSAAFVGLLEGHRLQTFILVQNLGEWSFKGRASGLPSDDRVSLVGSRVYGLALPENWETRVFFR